MIHVHVDQAKNIKNVAAVTNPRTQAPGAMHPGLFL